MTKLTGQVVVEVLDGALAGDDGLHEEAEHGEHGQAPVLDLLHLRSPINTLSPCQGVCLQPCCSYQADLRIFCKEDEWLLQQFPGCLFGMSALVMFTMHSRAAEVPHNLVDGNLSERCC